MLFYFNLQYIKTICFRNATREYVEWIILCSLVVGGVHGAGGKDVRTPVVVEFSADQENAIILRKLLG